MTIQKIDPRAGFTQLSGSGSPENSATGWVGQTYRNTDNNDLYEKSTGDNTNTGWVQKTGAGATIPDATETQAGKVELANKTEAEAGNDDGNKAMNPKKTKQAFDAFIAAYLSAKIIMTRLQTNEVAYNANVNVETPTALTTQGSITYSNGVYTVGKDCIVEISGSVSFRNNNAATSDLSYLSVSKSVNNGSTFTYEATLSMNPSSLISSSQYLIQPITPVALSLSNGDQIKIDISGVNESQYINSAIVSVFEK